MAYELNLDMYQATAIAALVLLFGKFLVKKIGFLHRYSIPEPVAGGFAFALLHLVLRSAGIVEISFDTTLQSFFMIVFFCSVGFNASFSLLRRGGRQVLVFLGLAVLLCVLQNGLGAGLATILGLDARLGIATGSISMTGGHGTAGSFGPLLEQNGVFGANAVAIAAATFGLLSGCMIGGPIATLRIRKAKLGPTGKEGPELSEENPREDKVEVVHQQKIMDAVLLLALAIGFGTITSYFLGKLMTFPMYMGALVTATILRNVLPDSKCPLPEINTVGSFCLSIFLGLAMMGLKLWQLADLALPMIVLLLAQTLLMVLYSYFVVFKAMGSNYDAAVMTSGFCGFGMGATPNAMANMQALTKRYGPSPMAFWVVPIVGSLFIDFFNAVVITAFINIF